MRRVRYSVAASLDGFIAGPSGEIDWILMDPDIDFSAIAGAFDTVLLGRGTYEVTRAQGSGAPMPGMKTYVFSRTLRQEDCPDVIVSAEPKTVVRDLKTRDGKDIWLFGGGVLCRSLLEAGLVDAVDVAIIPTVLGAGIPLVSELTRRADLKLTDHRAYPKTGTVLLKYEIMSTGGASSDPR